MCSSLSVASSYGFAAFGRSLGILGTISEEGTLSIFADWYISVGIRGKLQCVQSMVPRLGTTEASLLLHCIYSRCFCVHVFSTDAQ